MGTNLPLINRIMSYDWIMTETHIPAVRTGGNLAIPMTPIGADAFAQIREQLGTVLIDGIRYERLHVLAQVLDGGTFGLAVDWLTSTRRASVNTKRAYADDLRLWADVAAEKGHARFFIGCLTREDVRTWRLAQEHRDVAPRSISRRLATLSSLHKYAAEHSDDPVPPRNPVTQDDRPHIDRNARATATPVLSVDELQAVFAQARNAREALVLMLLYALAGRVSEVCAADVKHRIVNGRLVELDLTRKRGKKRVLPLPPRVAHLLDMHVADRSSGPLLLDAEGRRLDRFDVTRLLTRCGKHAGALKGRDVTPHVLRASRLTHMYQAGEALAEIQAFADHEDPSTTLRYIERAKADETNAQLVRKGEDVFADLADQWLTTVA